MGGMGRLAVHCIHFARHVSTLSLRNAISSSSCAKRVSMADDTALAWGLTCKHRVGK